MTIYYTPNTDWLSFTDYEWRDLNTWYNPTGLFAPGSDFTVTTASQDTGSRAWYVPTTTISTSGTGTANTYDVRYLISDDNEEFTEVAPGPMLGRYYKTQITTQLYSGQEAFENIITRLDSTPTSFRLDSIDTADLQPADPDTQTVADGLGVTQARTINFGTRFSKITGVSIEPAITETRTLSVVIVDATPGNFTFGLRDLDTWGKISVDAEISITVSGLPVIFADRSTGRVAPLG